MADDQPTDEAIRAKAYALWEARGRPDGDGQADWAEAKALLASPLPAAPTPGDEPPSPARLQEPQSAMQTLTDGIFGVTSAAIDAATQIVEGLFGGATAKIERSPTPARTEQTPGSDDNLEAAERRLQVEAEARRMWAGPEAAGTRPPDERQPG